MIKAVLFDIDGVLLDSLVANHKFYENLFTRAGYTPPTREEYAASMFFSTMIDVIRQVTQSDSAEEIERVRVMGLDRKTLYPLDLVKMPDDAAPTIELLAEKYALGLVTSRIKQHIFAIPQMARLQHFFPVVVAFEDVAKHKPDPEPLLLAASQLDILPESIVYIGDAETDFKAAKAAGMKIIMYNNTQLQGADGYISSFSELPALFSTL